MRQTQVLALLLGLEAISVAVAAAVPEPDALVLNGVEEPHHGVDLAAAGVLALEAGVCMERRRRTTPTPDWRNGRATVLDIRATGEPLTPVALMDHLEAEE